MNKNNKHWLQYSGIGIQMAATMIIAWWIGEKIETYFEILSKPLGQLIGLFFGLFAGIYNLINQIK